MRPILTLFAAASTAAILLACQPAVSNESNGPSTRNGGGANQATAAESNPSNTISYEGTIQQFRDGREAELKSDTGWLTIAGLYFLSQPSSTFGSDPLNDIVLPASAPKQAGIVEFHEGKVRVQAAAGIMFQLGDESVTSAELKSDRQGSPDKIGIGDLRLWVHMSGDRVSVRLSDRNNRLRREFKGTTWFPINEAYRVEGQYIPYDRPHTIEVANLLGDIDKMSVPGVVTFTLNGEPLKMEPIAEPGDKEFWFIFRDLTSGKETYPAARFLTMPAPTNGKIVLDFNMAENPPCAYNPFTTCPLPPEQNRLRVRVEAGEKTYSGHP